MKFIIFFLSIPQNNHRLWPYLSSSNSTSKDIQAADIILMLIDKALLELALIFTFIWLLSHDDSYGSLMIYDSVFVVEFQIVSAIKTTIS